jgi:deoxyribonuclease V
LDHNPKAQNAVKLQIRIPTRISTRDAIALQKKLSPLIKETSELPSKLEYLIGCDASYFQGTTIAAATLVSYDELKSLAVKAVKEPTRFPYIPGLLAFREGPAVVKAIKSLRANSYVCLVDAHGLAHPRRFGLACFVGLALDRPTIGIAKSLLFGQVHETQVLDRTGRQIAEIVPLPGSRRVIYVSIGHKISLTDAVRVVKHALSHRGPIPIALSHEEVTKQKWLLRKSSQVY